MQTGLQGVRLDLYRRTSLKSYYNKNIKIERLRKAFMKLGILIEKLNTKDD